MLTCYTNARLGDILTSPTQARGSGTAHKPVSDLKTDRNLHGRKKPSRIFLLIKFYITAPSSGWFPMVCGGRSRHAATETPSVMLGVQSISCNGGSVIRQRPEFPCNGVL